MGKFIEESDRCYNMQEQNFRYLLPVVSFLNLFKQYQINMLMRFGKAHPHYRDHQRGLTAVIPAVGYLQAYI